MIRRRFRRAAALMRDLISDEEWSFFEPFVTRRVPHSGRRPQDHRRALDGVFWIARTVASGATCPRSSENGHRSIASFDDGHFPGSGISCSRC